MALCSSLLWGGGGSVPTRQGVEVSRKIPFSNWMYLDEVEEVGKGARVEERDVAGGKTHLQLSSSSSSS